MHSQCNFVHVISCHLVSGVPPEHCCSNDMFEILSEFSPLLANCTEGRAYGMTLSCIIYLFVVST